MEDLKKLIREVPDFPKPGILFYDITTLLKDKCGFRAVIDGLKYHYREAQVDVVLGIEARGFIFAPALAYALGAGFVPVRKPKKLPAECVTVTYDLEYGTDSLQMHRDALDGARRVLIVDDLPRRSGGRPGSGPSLSRDTPDARKVASSRRHSLRVSARPRIRRPGRGISHRSPAIFSRSTPDR